MHFRSMSSFTGVSPLETIGELPEDGSYSDRDVIKTLPNFASGKQESFKEQFLKASEFGLESDIDTKVISTMINRNCSEEKDSSINDTDGSQIVYQKTQEDSGETSDRADCDSSSSLNTFASSLRQDLTPSPTISYRSHGSDDSLSDDEYVSSFQIQTFTLDDITHAGPSSTVPVSQSNIRSSFHVFSEETTFSECENKNKNNKKDECVHIEVHTSPPIKPTPPPRKKKKSPRRIISKPAANPSTSTTPSPTPRPQIMPLLADIVKEKDKADSVEMSKENEEILAHINQNGTMPQSTNHPNPCDTTIVQPENIQTKNKTVSFSRGTPEPENIQTKNKTVSFSRGTPDGKSNSEVSEPKTDHLCTYVPSKSNNGLTKAALKSTKRTAHHYVTEEHELEPDQTTTTVLPGTTSNSEETCHAIHKSSEHLPDNVSSSSKQSSSTKKTGSFYGAINRLKKAIKPDYYLPRHSFYSSHDRALKEAGYDLNQLKQDITKEIKEEKEVSKMRKTTVAPKNAWSTGGTKKSRKNIFKRKSSTIMEITKEDYDKIVGRRESDMNRKGRKARNKAKIAKEKAAQEKKQNLKNAKRIVDYLKLVKEYPEQYEILRRSEAVSKNKGEVVVFSKLLHRINGVITNQKCVKNLYFNIVYEINRKRLISYKI